LLLLCTRGIATNWHSPLTQQHRAMLTTPWLESVNELYGPSDRSLSAKLVLTFADKGCHVVCDGSLRPYLGFLDRSRYFLFQVAPQLYSRGRVDPVPDPLFLRKSGSAWNRTRTSGSVPRNRHASNSEDVRSSRLALCVCVCVRGWAPRGVAQTPGSVWSAAPDLAVHDREFAGTGRFNRAWRHLKGS
jgi:hypothetical protein